MVMYVNAIMASTGIPPSEHSFWGCEVAKAAVDSNIPEKQ